MTAQEIKTTEKQAVQQPQEQTRPGRYYSPEVDIFETRDALKIRADMPGVRDKDVSVTLHDGILTIIGNVATDIYANLTPLYTEYNVGNYIREFALNEDIEEGGIRAKLRNGVLEVELPKKEKAKPRRIEVQGA